MLLLTQPFIFKKIIIFLVFVVEFWTKLLNGPAPDKIHCYSSKVLWEPWFHIGPYWFKLDLLFYWDLIGDWLMWKANFYSGGAFLWASKGPVRSLYSAGPYVSALVVPAIFGFSSSSFTKSAGFVSLAPGKLLWFPYIYFSPFCENQTSLLWYNLRESRLLALR